MKRVFLWFFLLTWALAQTACQATEVATVTSEAVPQATAVAEVATETATALPTDTATAVPTHTPAATSTNLPAPPTLTRVVVSTVTVAPSLTAVLTSTATSEATAVGTVISTTTTAGRGTATVTPTAGATVTATATLGAVAPPAGGVEQPPYAASACSDKYPCNDDKAGWESRIRVPAGFQATYYGRVDAHPTSITFGPDGKLYIATMPDSAGLAGSIFTMDSSGTPTLYVSGFLVPTGIAFQPGTDRLYVSSRVLDQNVGGEAKISVVQGGGVSTIISGLPCCYTSLHSANGIAFGSDGFGYVGVGGRADHGEILEGPNAGQQDELQPYEASILRFSPDGGSVEVYSRGFRNPYDIAWDGNGQLWATDNMPDFGPPERLHRVRPGGQHGYPWFDCDVCFTPPADVTVIPPAVTFPSHSSPTGITAYLSNQFPGYYNSLFVTLWSAFPGAQKVVRMGPGGSAPSNFATGFADPVDVTVGPDGSLFVADWATGIIFKISYHP